MEGQLQTSFIPRKPLVQPVGTKKPRTVNFFSLIAGVIFVTILIVAGGIFAYKFYLNRQITNQSAELTNTLKQFDPAMIDQFSRLDARLRYGKTLLDQHLALSPFYDFLSVNTLKNVRFSTFSYSGDDKKTTVTMSGQAQSFAAVALQLGKFNEAANVKYIKDVVFSNVNLDQSGNVSFSMTGTLDPKLVSYRSSIAGEPISTVPSATTTATTTTLIGTTTASTTPH